MQFANNTPKFIMTLNKAAFKAPNPTQLNWFNSILQAAYIVFPVGCCIGFFIKILTKVFAAHLM